MYQNFATDVMDDWFYDTANDDASDALLDGAIDQAQPHSRRLGRVARRSGARHICQERFDGCVSLGPRSVSVCDECRRECSNTGRWPYDKCPRPGSRTPPSRFDAYDDFVDFETAADFDAFEDALVDALDEEDTDEFFRRLVRGIGRVARGIGRGIGRVARVVAPIASAIPLPWTQAIGRVARIAGRVLADGGDEFDAIDALVDLAETDDLMDAAAPAIATMAVHGTMPQAARLPPATRQQLVRSTTQAAQAIARQQGTQAVRALPAIVQTAERIARQRSAPPTALPRLVQQVAHRLSRNPQMIRRLMQSASPALRQPVCAACGRSHARPATAQRAM